MHIRPMLPADIPSVAALGARAFIDDELFVWLHPHSQTYFSSWYDGIVRRARQRLCTPGSHAFVAVLDHRDTALAPEGTIAGYCFWERAGPPDSATAAAWRTNNSSMGDWIERRLLSIESWYANLVGMDRSADWANVRKLDNLDLFRNDRYAVHCPDNWHLRVLGVAPEFQRKGVGSLLVEWGLANARREDVPAVLEASDMGSRLYAKMGFKTISWQAGIPIPDSAGGQVMVYDPTGRFVREAVGDERNVKIDSKDKKINIVWKTNVTPADVAVAKQVEEDVDQLGNKP